MLRAAMLLHFGSGGSLDRHCSTAVISMRAKRGREQTSNQLAPPCTDNEYGRLNFTGHHFGSKLRLVDYTRFVLIARQGRLNDRRVER
jgi:hypothetical protein